MRHRYGLRLQLVDEPIAHLSSRAKKADAFFKVHHGFPAPADEYAAAQPSMVCQYPAGLVARLRMLHPTTDCRHADVHCLAHVRDAEALFFDHTNDLELEAGVDIAALPGHVNSFEGELSAYRGVRGH